ncbi:hypothetical protein VSDG_05434 [Cytospora chrysosperma]|uniref:Uncharacterized protein n=1 Tax=Cytospora chrysosperma TaxID=252740 RepID=A0A423VZH6_CYTCH|nr:hypothetical protein VSDG_05434 [Valsa sordida]
MASGGNFGHPQGSPVTVSVCRVPGTVNGNATQMFPDGAASNHVASRMLYVPVGPMDDGKPNDTSRDKFQDDN